MMPQNDYPYTNPNAGTFPPAPQVPITPEEPKPAGNKIAIIAVVVAVLVVIAAAVPLMMFVTRPADNPDENSGNNDPDVHASNKFDLTKEEAMALQTKMYEYNNKSAEEDGGLQLYVPDDYLDKLAASIFVNETTPYIDKSVARDVIDKAMSGDKDRCGTYKVSQREYYIVAKWDKRYADHGTHVCFDEISFDISYKEGNIDAAKEFIKLRAIRDNLGGRNVYAHEFVETDSTITLKLYRIGAGPKMGSYGLMDFSLREDHYDATKYTDINWYLFLFTNNYVCDKDTLECSWFIDEDVTEGSKDLVFKEWEITAQEANKMINREYPH